MLDPDAITLPTLSVAQLRALDSEADVDALDCLQGHYSGPRDLRTAHAEPFAGRIVVRTKVWSLTPEQMFMWARPKR